MLKRKLSDDQNQQPNKFRKSESLLPVQNALMMSGEAGPSPPQLPKDYTAGPGSMEISQPSPSDLSDICIQEKDLSVLNTCVKDREYVWKTQSFPFVALAFREIFREHTGLASRLKIFTGNLEEYSSRYREINSDETLQRDLFDALSNVAKNPQVQTWNAVFNHCKLELDLFYRASHNFSSTLQT
jgi:hypothetical protein